MRGRPRKFQQSPGAQGIAGTIGPPKAGVKGNSHTLMIDRNCDRVAQMVQGRVAKQGLMK